MLVVVIMPLAAMVDDPSGLPDEMEKPVVHVLVPGEGGCNATPLAETLGIGG